MKKMVIFLAILILSMPVFAFELPAGKTINKEAVNNSIETYSKKINENPEAQEAYVDRAFLYFLLDDIKLAIEDYDKLVKLNLHFLSVAGGVVCVENGVGDGALPSLVGAHATFTGFHGDAVFKIDTAVDVLYHRLYAPLYSFGGKLAVYNFILTHKPHVFN